MTMDQRRLQMVWLDVHNALRSSLASLYCGMRLYCKHVYASTLESLCCLVSVDHVRALIACM